jgi:protein TonB
VRQDPPRYPQWDLRAGVEGSVILRLTVGRSGAVENAEVVRSLNSRIDAEAMRAAGHWRYQPARLNGQAVRAYKIVSIRFAISR